MKKMLFILLVLAFSIPVFAQSVSNVFVYNWKEKSTDYEQYDGDWYFWKDNYKGYIVLEIEGEKAYAIFIETWTEKWNGKTYKLMADWEESFSVVMVPSGKKTICVLSSGDDASRALLTGEVKNDVVAKLAGTAIWDEIDDPDNRDIGASQVSGQLNKKWTSEVNGLSASDAAQWVADRLMEKGYEWD